MTSLTSIEMANASKLTKADREAKLQFIAGLCAKLRIQRGKTAMDLALIWGVEPATVNLMIREAKQGLARAIGATVGTPEEMMLEYMGNLEFLMTDAMQAKKTVFDGEGNAHEVDAPDRKAALAAQQELIRLLSLGGKGAISPYGDKTKDEIRTLAEKAIKQIRAAQKEVPAEGTESHEAERVLVEHGVGGQRLERADEPVEAGDAGGRAGTGGEHRAPRVRSGDLVHPRPGPPDSSPKRVRQNPQAKGRGDGQ